MSQRVTQFDDLVAASRAAQPRQARRLIALAGPPASGKSTLAPALAKALTDAGQPTQVVPMDGFHLDDTLLGPRGLLPRKGAPETFDIRGFSRFLNDLASGGDIYHPLFDRTREIALAQAGCVPDACHSVIVEGNYLLLDAPGWRDLSSLWDLSIYLPIPNDILRARLLARWRGLGLTEETARSKALSNDIPNGERVATALLPPDIYYEDEPK